MNRWCRVVIGVAIALLVLLSVPGLATAQIETTPLPKTTAPKTPPNPFAIAQSEDSSARINPDKSATSFWEKLDRLREDKQLRELVEDDIEKSITIRGQIQAEVDRAFGHTTTLLNVLLAVLTCLPILAAASIWFVRRSVINQMSGDIKRLLREEVEKQLEEEVAAELKQQAEAFQQKIEQLETEFQSQLAQLKTLFSDAQRDKDQIIQELAQLTPSPFRELAEPEVHEKVQSLTKQLDALKSANNQLSFTANDYIEQGKALHFENRYEDAIACYDKAIQMEPDSAKAWFSRGAALVKLQQCEPAIAAYDRALEIKPDFPEAWFGRGTALAKLQQYDPAIAAYQTAIDLKPDLFFAQFGKARCYALQGNLDQAVEALQQAMELNPEKSKEMAKTDPAFEQIRENSFFDALVNP